MFRYVGTLILGYLCLASGAPLEAIGTRSANPATIDGSFVVDGIDLTKLDEEGLKRFSEAEDEKLIGELDLESGKVPNAKTKRIAPIVYGAGVGARLSPYAFRAARLLYKTVRSRGVPKVSKGKLTQNYFSKGNLLTGYRHFNRLTGGNYKRFKSGPVSGFRGKVGRHSVILRNGSGKGGRGPPTLEIQTPNYRNGVNMFRKFRFW